MFKLNNVVDNIICISITMHFGRFLLVNFSQMLIACNPLDMLNPTHPNIVHPAHLSRPGNSKPFESRALVLAWTNWKPINALYLHIALDIGNCRSLVASVMHSALCSTLLFIHSYRKGANWKTAWIRTHYLWPSVAHFRMVASQGPFVGKNSQTPLRCCCSSSHIPYYLFAIVRTRK